MAQTFNKNMELTDSIYKKLFISIIALCTVLYFALLGGKYVWADEAYTFAMLRHSYAEIWKITAADVHPPLYYYILKLLTKPFDYSLVSAKIVSVFPFLFIIVFGGIQFRKLFGKNEAIGFMLLFFLFPFSLQYSIEVRMYSWAAAFVFSNAVFAYRCYQESKISNWIFFALTGVCSAYTHYFSLASTGIVYILLLLAIRFRKKELLPKWLIFSVLTAVLYLPWMKSFIEQMIYKVNHEYWIAPLTLYDVASYIASLFGASHRCVLTLITAPLLFLAYLTALIFVIKRKRNDHAALALCSLAVPVGTVAIGVLASILVRPVFIIRYITPTVPLLVTFFVLSLRNVTRIRLQIFAICISLIAGILNYAVFARSEYEVIESALDRDYLNKYDSVDSYVVTADCHQVMVVLPYYDPVKQIYSEDYVHSADRPFENLYTIEQFDPESNDTVMMFVGVGEEIEDQYTSAYHCEYLGQINVYGGPGDAYLLTK